MGRREAGDPTVLLVDDESRLVRLFSLYLEDSFTVLTATGGEKALELVDESVDAVVLDRRMPDLNGDEVLERLRAEGYDIPVAMATAVDPGVDIVDMPFDEYLTKPIDREKLRGTIELLLARANYDKKSREFFRLASKRAALESEGRFAETNSEEYQDLIERMETLQAELDDTLQTIVDENPAEAFRTF